MSSIYCTHCFSPQTRAPSPHHHQSQHSVPEQSTPAHTATHSQQCGTQPRGLWPVCHLRPHTASRQEQRSLGTLELLQPSLPPHPPQRAGLCPADTAAQNEASGHASDPPQLLTRKNTPPRNRLHFSYLSVPFPDLVLTVCCQVSPILFF